MPNRLPMSDMGADEAHSAGDKIIRRALRLLRPRNSRRATKFRLAILKDWEAGWLRSRPGQPVRIFASSQAIPEGVETRTAGRKVG